MASLHGIAAWAVQNNAVGDALRVNVGGVIRCGVVVMAQNRLAGGVVPQFRFACDGYCGIVPKKSSKRCKAIDRAAVGAGAPVAPPPGLVGDTGVKVGAGGGGGGRAMTLPQAMPPGLVGRYLQ